MGTQVVEPTLYVVDRPSFDLDEFLRFLSREEFSWRRTESATPAEEIVEAAGRVCYMSFGDQQSRKTNTEYIQNLLARSHESVLEHVSWGFVLTGVSRAFSHQLVRHRVGFSISQLSQQYHDERGARAVMPRVISKYPELAAIWHQSVSQSQRAYDVLHDRLDRLAEDSTLSPDERRERRRAIRSAARSVLPEATETKIFITANARAIRHFLTLRGSIVGDEEMRLVSAALLKAVQVEAPSLFADFEILEQDGLPLVQTRFGGD